MKNKGRKIFLIVIAILSAVVAIAVLGQIVRERKRGYSSDRTIPLLLGYEEGAYYINEDGVPVRTEDDEWNEYLVDAGSQFYEISEVSVTFSSQYRHQVLWLDKELQVLREQEVRGGEHVFPIMDKAEYLLIPAQKDEIFSVNGRLTAAGAEESAAHCLDPQPEAIVGFGGELQRLGGVAGIIRDEADAAFVPPGGEKLHLTEPGIVADAEVVGEFDVLYFAVAFLPFADDHPFAEGIEEFVIERDCDMRRFDEIGQKVGRNSGERRAEPEGAVLAVADFESEQQSRHGAALRPARLARLEAERGKAGVIKFEVVPVLPQKAERKGPFRRGEQRKIAVFQRENGAVFPGEDQPALSVVPMDLIHKKPLCC